MDTDTLNFMTDKIAMLAMQAARQQEGIDAMAQRLASAIDMPIIAGTTKLDDIVDAVVARLDAHDD